MTALDPRAILAALGIPNADAVTTVQGGRDAALFRVRRDADVYALRVFRLGDERASEREIAVMRAAQAAGIPVPSVHAAGVWRGRPALLLAWCSGQTLFDALLAQPDRAEPLGVAAGAMLARIHAVAPPAVVASRSWLDWFAIPAPLLRALEAAARPGRLLHLDYHPLNLLTDGVGITAVLDWSNAHSGDPRADVARSIAILRLNADEAPVEIGPVVAAFERGLLDAYTEATGPVEDLPLFLAWAGYGMLHDLAHRLDQEKRARIVAWTTEREREAGLA